MTKHDHGRAVSPDLRSFGRKRGRKLSRRQSKLVTDVLPRWQIDLERVAQPGELGKLFDPPVQEVWLEIGFGGGEHLLHQALAHPDVGIIGCEPFLDGVVKVLSTIVNLQIGNIRLHPDDVRPLIRALPEGSLSRVFILYPDPWPKARHAKRRLVSTQFLGLLSRAMTPGAELRIATDIPAYARSVVLAAHQSASLHWTARSADDWRVPWADWPGTRYETKAKREGRRPIYLTYRKV